MSTSRLPFSKLLHQSEPFRKMAELQPSPGEPVFFRGLAGSLLGFTVAQTFEKRGKQVLVLTATGDSALDVWNDAALLIGEEKAVFVGERTTKHKQMLDNAESSPAENADILRGLIEEPVKLAVAAHETLLERFPSVDEISRHSLRLDAGALMEQDELIRRLGFGGFERNDFVTAVGEYAVRGGIVDVFPIGFDNPIRVEFFGDEIDTIREFDSLSQRSIRQMKSISLVTSLFYAEDGENAGGAALTDFLASDCLIIVEDLDKLESFLEEQAEGEAIFASLNRYSVFASGLLSSYGKETVDFGAASQPAFNASVAVLRKHILELEAQSYTVVLAADSPQQQERLGELLMDASANEDEDTPPTFRAAVLHLPISQGFLIPSLRLAVYTEHEIFNRKRIRKLGKKGKKGISLRELKQLHVGDYVVHADKGIGKFVGFHSITVNGGVQETAKILYADNDVLYVNLNYLGKLQKYSSEEGHAPKLSKLGSGEWDRLKAKTKSRLKDIARDLITLYAKRKMSKGFAFSPDSAWQKEMEASFIYEDTPDQYKATVEVKRDMEDSQPMDRLVCGDVGYGKTEVAMRAAFKAVMDGKQTAVLVPTTILAQQHYNSFQDRLHRYSVRVEALSRFRSTAEQKKILEDLKKGRIDVLIGTHRMLSKDVAFRDLGLLIIDEEHRFGVAAKENLRTLRENVDTLTLTATPIPRTLNFSLLGARDLSVIETPPKNRLPIITEIVPYQDDIVAEGIMREINRGGQVYFVHDRIGDIEMLADKIRHAAPGVVVIVAHGQMPGADLEKVMMRFMEKKIHVLLATKIVESGLDIPNANTIFINRAERFGLAELYQLRGRVGRSNTQAYAYLLVQKGTKLSRDAIKRLQALEEFSELGTGFQLAMRDMEIRGAGNLLGAEQSGFIAEIGFELYLSTLEEAVKELKEEEFKELFAVKEGERKPDVMPRSDVVMEVGLDAFFPQDYIRSSSERFELYRRLYKAVTDEEIKDVEQEAFDRFGLFPQEADNLFYIVRLRLVAARIRLSRVTWDREHLTLVFPPPNDESFYTEHFPAVMTWIGASKRQMKLEQDRNQVSLVISNVAALPQVEELLNELAAATVPLETAASEEGVIA